MKEKIKLIEEKIVEDLSGLNEEKIELFFDKFKDDRTFSFIKYYNKTVLDKGRISFGEFVSWRNWAIRGMSRMVYNYFDKNYDKIIKEIKRKMNIEEFFNKYCKAGSKITNSKRNEVVFCSKLFHTVLPNEYPPIDSHILKEFGLLSDIANVLIVKKAYENSSKDNKDKLDIVRKVLAKDKFSEFRINELSDMRILDMFYWYRNSTN